MLCEKMQKHHPRKEFILLLERTFLRFFSVYRFLSEGKALTRARDLRKVRFAHIRPSLSGWVWFVGKSEFVILVQRRPFSTDNACYRWKNDISADSVASARSTHESIGPTQHKSDILTQMRLKERTPRVRQEPSTTHSSHTYTY